MKNIFIICCVCLAATSLSARNECEADTIITDGGPLIISFFGHGTLMFRYNDIVVHVDPVSGYADYNTAPKADIILVTHHHGDHLDLSAINKIRTDNTKIYCSETCIKTIKGAAVLANGEADTCNTIPIQAVPAYNIVNKRKNGIPFHPKGVGNGYVIEFGGKSVYVAGDTEDIPEMKDLNGRIDIAFLPMNLPYTMSPEMTARAVCMINPKIVYPYHFGNTDPMELVTLLKDKKDCKVRIRQMQ